MRRLFLPLLLIAAGTLLAAPPTPPTTIPASTPATQPLVNPALDPPLPPNSADDLYQRMAQRRAQQLGIPYTPPATPATTATTPSTNAATAPLFPGASRGSATGGGFGRFGQGPTNGGFGGSFIPDNPNAPLVNPSLDPPLPPDTPDMAARMAQRRAAQLSGATLPAPTTTPNAPGQFIQPANPQPPLTPQEAQAEMLRRRHAAEEAALAALATQPSLPPRPATVRFILLDAQRQSLPATKITASLNNSKEPLTSTTDLDGRASFTFPDLPADIRGDIPNASFSVVQPGLAPYSWHLTLFEGARIERTIQLIPSRKTLIHVRGPGGQPVERVSLLCDGYFVAPSDDPLQVHGYSGQYSLDEFTDVHGDFLWEHWPYPGGLIITVGGQDAPRPLAAVRSPELDELTITLSPEALAQVFPTRVLSVKLLHTDGTPANDWFIAGHVMASGISSASSGPFVAYSANYDTESLAHPAADGTLEIRAPCNFLGLVSPEGFHFLFALNPRSWPPGIHQVTLTVPQNRGTFRTRLLDPAGTPLPNLPVTLSGLRTGNNDWSLNLHTASRIAPIDSGSMLSDADGWLSIPNYVGAHAIISPPALTFGSPVAGLSPGRGSSYRPVSRSSNLSDTTVLQPVTPYQPSPTASISHHITLAFVDPAGKPVPDVRLERIDGSGPVTAFGGISGLASNFISTTTPPRDSAGYHIFVPPTITTLTINIAPGFCKRAEQTLTLDGSPRQTLTIPVEPFRPLRGRILDPAGKPLPNATVSLSLYSGGKPARTPNTTGLPLPSDFDNVPDLNLRATTDTDGRFAFPGAPDECFATVTHHDLLYNSDLPPMPPEPIGPNDRDILLRIPASGALSILLPDQLTMARNAKFDLLPTDPQSDVRLTVAYDPTLHALASSAIPPGHYHLPADLFPHFGDLSTHDILITLNQTTTLDLRRQPPAPWAAGTMKNLSLLVQRDGQPVSGAEVAIFADNLPVEVVQRRVDAWLKAATDEDRRAAAARLYEAANLVPDLLPNATDPEGMARILALRLSLPTLLNAQDNLNLLFSDLSPDDGTIHFHARAGQICVAAARIRGTALGLAKFTVPSGADAPVGRSDPTTATPPILLSLQPLRPLIIHVPPAPPNPNGFPSPPPSFTLDLPHTLESRALLRSLDNDHRWDVGPYGNHPATLTFRRTADTLSFDALPVGISLISAPYAPLGLTIPPGTGPYEYSPPTPPQ